MTAVAVTPGLYRGLVTAAGPLIGLYLRRRLAHGKEDPARFRERLGHPGIVRGPGPVVWVHAASVGEAVSVLPLIERLSGLGRVSVLMTTGTVTSARLMAERLPAGARHQYVPIDRADAVRRFLDHWRPAAALWTESEFWPNLLGETLARGIPCVLVNARLSARSLARWRRARALIAPLLAGFTVTLAADEATARRLTALGARRVAVLGNLKWAAAPLPADPPTLAALAEATSGRPLWLAASTHAGEEAAVARVHAALAPAHPGLLTLVVPRHPERGAEAAAAFAAQGIAVARRTQEALPPAVAAAYVADTLGELGLFYRLAPIALVGGSLVPHGGHNPLEPARLGAAILAGPHMANFAAITARLEAAGGLLRVAADAEAVAAAVAALLADEGRRAALGEAARQAAEAEAGVLDAVWAAVAPVIEAAVGGGAGA